MKIEEIQIKLFRLLNKGSNFPNDEEMRTIIQASNEIKKAVVEVLPKALEVKIIEARKNPKPIDYLLEGRKEGYNQCLSDIIKAVENL